MRTKVVINKFQCDRCGTETEKNKHEVCGTLIEFRYKKTHDMIHGNHTDGTIELCQKCTDSFLSFMACKEYIDVKDLIYYKDTTVGVYATDRPDLIADDNKIMFELSFDKKAKG